MEHLHHFGLSDDPFRNEPLPRLFVETSQQRDALRRLERGVRQAKALCVLSGETGSGKTLVVRQLLENLEEEVFEASMMVVLHASADATWMLNRFARQLGIEEPPAERENLLAQVYERLAIIREDGRQAVLIIDDAQALADPATLTEICGLLKLEYEDRRLLTLVLAGTPELFAALTSDLVLAHRVDVNVVLRSLDADTVRSYLGHRIQAAGGDPKIVDDGAFAALHELSRGIPGRANTLADNALFEAFLCGRDRVLRTDVERAHRDLGWDRAATSSLFDLTNPEPADAVEAPAPETRGNGSRPLAEAEVTAPESPAVDALETETFEDLDSDLDSELEAVFEAAPGGAPPKVEADDEDDLFAELIDD